MVQTDRKTEDYNYSKNQSGFINHFKLIETVLINKTLQYS